MASEEELAAARAAVDQAQAAVDEYRPHAEEAASAYQAIANEKTETMAALKARLNEAYPAVEESSGELAKREGALRAAQEKVRILEQGGTYEEPPAQGVGE